MTPPPAAVADVPDLWGVWSRIDEIRAKAQLPDFAAWQSAFLDRAATELTCASPPPATVDAVRRLAEVAQTAGFAFVLTGDERYARRAAEAFELVGAWAGPWYDQAHHTMYPWDEADLYTAEVIKACASALSFVGPILSSAQRQAAVDLVAERGGKPTYESARRGSWWGNAPNSNWTAVLNSGLGFAALLWRRRDPVAATAWLAWAQARLTEMLDLAQDEGAGVEGPGYWLYNFGSIQDLVEALRNTGGPDLYGHPFWRRCSRFLPYLALPDLSAWVNYADTGYKGLGGSHFFAGVAARTGDPLAQWFGNTIRRRHGGGGWKDLIYYEPSVPEQPVCSEPTCRFFSSVHLASFRSGWDPDATFMLFKGGSNVWSHTHLDQNSFVIVSRGERLAADPGPSPYSLHYWHSVEPAVSTAWHNCVVVDGADQRAGVRYGMSYDLDDAGDCYSRLQDHISTASFEMIRGDASTAYGDTLERAWREVVYLKPDVFVIHDDLIARPVRGQRNFEWLLHSECPLVDVPGGVEAQGQRVRLLVQPVLPTGWEHKYVTGKTVAYAGHKPLFCVSIRQKWYHKWNEDPHHSPFPHWHPRGEAQPLYGPDYQYLVVLSVLDPGAAPRYRLEAVGQGTAHGVRLLGATEQAVVVFNPNHESLRFDGVATDAAKVVVRAGADRISWALVRSTHLEWQGRELQRTPVRTSGSGTAAR